MTETAISRLSAMLKATAAPAKVSEAKKDDALPEDGKHFDSFIKVLEKEFGKDNILCTDASAQMLKVVLTRESYTCNQSKFELKGREDWLNANQMAILSIMPDAEPESTKIYFCKIQTLNAPE